MKINLKKNIIGGLTVLAIATFTSCGPDLSPGVEYMPDMYRSPSIEPYVDNAEYGYPDSMSARKPVEGTIPRGSFRPFAYENTLEDYEKAGNEMVNPIQLNSKTY